MSGDGGLAMIMRDLLTLQQLQAAVKVIVFRNDSLAFVELGMKAAGILDFGTDLNNPSFAKMAWERESTSSSVASFGSESAYDFR